jgi:hypothetical protein
MRGTAWVGGYDRRVGDFTERIEHLSQRIASAKEFL